MARLFYCLRLLPAVGGQRLADIHGLGKRSPALVSADAGVAERYPEELRPLLLPDPEDAVDLARRLVIWRADAAAYRQATLRLSERLRAWSWDASIIARFPAP